jgi:hypothetical protein
MPSTSRYEASYNSSMDNVSKLILAEMMKRTPPDMSHVKPLTEHAVKAMIRNLRAAAKK